MIIPENADINWPNTKKCKNRLGINTFFYILIIVIFILILSCVPLPISQVWMFCCAFFIEIKV